MARARAASARSAGRAAPAASRHRLYPRCCPTPALTRWYTRGHATVVRARGGMSRLPMLRAPRDDSVERPNCCHRRTAWALGVPCVPPPWCALPAATPPPQPPTTLSRSASPPCHRMSTAATRGSGTQPWPAPHSPRTSTFAVAPPRARVAEGGGGGAPPAARASFFSPANHRRNDGHSRATRCSTTFFSFLFFLSSACGPRFLSPPPSGGRNDGSTRAISGGRVEQSGLLANRRPPRRRRRRSAPPPSPPLPPPCPTAWWPPTWAPVLLAVVDESFTHPPRACSILFFSWEIQHVNRGKQ